MADNNDKLGVSVAMMITIVGLVMVAGGTFVGCLLLNFGVWLSALCALAVILLAGGGVFMATRAKMEVSEKTGMARYGGIALAVCFLGLVLSLWPTMTAINFLGENKDLRREAAVDIDGLQNQLREFKRIEKDRLATTRQGMDNIARFGNARFTDSLSDFFTMIGVLYEAPGQHAVLDPGQCDVWKQGIERRINRIGIGSNEYDEEFQGDISGLRDFMSSTDPALYARFSSELQDIAANQSEVLGRVSADLVLPVISAGEDSMRYRMVLTPAREYAFQPEAYGRSFAKVSAFHWLSMLIAVVGAAFVTAYYFLTVKPLRGTLSRGPRKSDLYGLPLSSPNN